MIPRIQLSGVAARTAEFLLVGVIVAALVVTFRHGLTLVIGERMSFVSGKTLLLWAIGIVLGVVAVVLASRLWRT